MKTSISLIAGTLLSGMLTLGALPAAAAPTSFTTIDLSSSANRSWTGDWGANFPTGGQTFNGTPFQIASDTNGARYASAIYGSANPIVIAMDVKNAVSANSLINTIWGQPGPNSYLSITFTGSAGAVQTFDLVGDSDIRDFNNYAYTNTINGTTTVNAIYVDGGQHRLDEQTYALSSLFQTQDLISVTMTDTGGDGFSRGALTGLTIESQAPGGVPEPAAWSLMIVGFGLIGGVTRRRRLSAPLHA